MRSNTLAFAVVLAALALAAPAAAGVSGFRLPEDRPQQTPPPDLQGPVAPDVPESQPAPQPQPSARVAETVAPAPPAIEVPVTLEARPQPSPSREVAEPRTAAVVPAPAATPVEAAAPAPDPGPVVSPEAAASGGRESSIPAAPRSDDPGGVSWLWLLALVPLLAAVAWLVRRRLDRPRAVAVPEIARPRIEPRPPSPIPTRAAMPGSASAAAAEPLQLSLEPLRLSLTLLNATLAYRLELTNRGTSALTGVTVGADMISAHASLSREEQLAGPRRDAGEVRPIERLEPGETRTIEGEFRLPFPQIVPIRQGSAALLLPLARFRIQADGAAPFVRTFIVGQPGQGTGLQPFRLDQGPRVYPTLAQHAFA